jgi:hypothetical protein
MLDRFYGNRAVPPARAVKAKVEIDLLERVALKRHWRPNASIRTCINNPLPSSAYRSQAKRLRPLRMLQAKASQAFAAASRQHRSSMRCC